MKAIILDSENNVVNICTWSEDSSAPEGFTVDLVNDDFIIDINWKKNGNDYIAPPKPPKPLPTEEEYTDAIQDHINFVARSKKYTNGFAFAGYVNSTVSDWASEASKFIAWRDSVWVYVIAELEKVKNNQRTQPTIEELILELPVINWT